MFKRTFAAAIAAIMLAAATAPGATADGAAPIAAEAAAPYSVEDGAITVPCGTTAAELLSCFSARAALTLADKGGAAIGSAEPVGSGAIISNGGGSVTVVVPGDLTGDAKINVRDVIAAMKLSLGESTGFAAAGDVNADGAVNSRDVTALMRSLVGYAGVFDAPITPAESDDPAIGMYFDSIMHRVGRSDTAAYGARSGVVYMAKNELEDAQIVLTATEDKSGLTLDVGALAAEGGAALGFEVRYGYYYDLDMFNVLRGADWTDYNEDYYTDPYPMLNGQSFTVGANESKSFMIKIDAPADAESGWYSAPVVVRDAEGREVKRSALHVYVWDFALDEETACDTLFCTSPNDLYANYASKGYDVSDWETVYAENWYGYMMKNRLNGYVLPYEITDARADAYLDDPRVTAFVTAGGQYSFDWDDGASISALRAKYDKLKTNGEWLDKAYIYTVDEPGGDVARVKYQWDRASALLPDVHFQTIVPGASAIEDMFDYCNAFAPCSDNFLMYGTPEQRRSDPYHYPPYARYSTSEFKKYGQFTDRYEKLRERGDNLWWYICVSPTYPYANLFNCYQGAWCRTVLWQQYMNGVDGLLYWNTVFWTIAEGASRPISLTRTNSGDGLLFYDGDWWGEGMVPVPTGRFEFLRDGIEDFQYLKQYERAASRDGAMTYVNRITEGMLTFNEDYRNMERVRLDLGFALELAAHGAQ